MPGSDKPNMMWSIFTMKCPRCRRGRMFSNHNPWKLREVLKMKERCDECGQPFELEVGFWYGTGYVSYAVTVLFSLLTLLAWWIFIGLSTTDNRFFWWFGSNAVLLLLLQPWLMRFSRVLYLCFFVHYDKDYKTHKVKKFDYESEDYYQAPPAEIKK